MKGGKADSSASGRNGPVPVGHGSAPTLLRPSRHAESGQNGEALCGSKYGTNLVSSGRPGLNRCRELLARAQDHPAGMTFRDLCALAECFGFHLARKKGSHHIFKRRGFHRLLNFQESGGMAKSYQARQLLAALRELGVLEEGS